MNTTGLGVNPSVLLTFDVEDWFQVENFKAHIPYASWPERQLRVEKNTHVILDLLDAFEFKPKATFFVLGWIAQKIPALVREIHDRGHEVASHGDQHHLCTNQNSKDVLEDLKAGKKRLEDIIGNEIRGYRAPSFAVNNDILKLIRETGHSYDSSFNSFDMHGRYGKIDLSTAAKFKGAFKVFNDFYELPVSNLKIGNRVIPLGGGGYFRLLPFVFFKAGMKQIIKREKMFVFYSHPWEFDPDQPRVDEAPSGFKFRHYVNLHRTHKKLASLLAYFSELDFITCRDYLELS